MQTAMNNFDNYTDEEIRTIFRGAKDKERFLKYILPDLTLKSEEQLRAIVFGGEELKENELKRKPKTLIYERRMMGDVL